MLRILRASIDLQGMNLILILRIEFVLRVLWIRLIPKFGSRFKIVGSKLFKLI